MPTNTVRLLERFLAIIGVIATVFSCYIGIVALSRPQVIQVLIPFSAQDTPEVKQIIITTTPERQTFISPSSTPKQLLPTDIPTRVSPTIAPTPVPPSKSAGESYTQNGVTVSMKKDLWISDVYFGPSFEISNNSGRQLVVVWKESFVHVYDDKGREYYGQGYGTSYYDQAQQFSMNNGDRVSLDSGVYLGGGMNRLSFKGQIDPDAKYLLVAFDQIAGMRNLRWRYIIQQ